MDNNESFVETHPLTPVGPAEDLFISGASVFEITEFEPPLQRVTIVGINLPDPGVFGPYDSYVATLQIPDSPPDEITSMVLEPTANEEVWAATTFLTFGGTLFPINVVVRPQLDNTRVGEPILRGPVLSVE